MIRKLTVGALLLVGFLAVGVQNAEADYIFSGCDVANANTVNTGNDSAICTSGLVGAEGLTAYGVGVYIHASSTNAQYVGFRYNGLNAGDTCTPFASGVVEVPQTTGYFVFEFTNPILITDDSEFLEIGLYSNSNCSTSANGNWVRNDVVANNVQEWFWDENFNSTATRINTVDPYNGETVATSTSVSIGSTGYISEEDYTTGSVVNIRFTKNETQLENTGLLPGIGLNCQFGVGPFCFFSTNQEGTQEFNFPLSADGAYSVSTTTQITGEGRYTMKTKITRPGFGILGISLSQQTLVSTTTTFVAGETNAVDNLVIELNEGIYNTIINTASSSCAISTNWNLGDCIAYLVFPNNQAFDQYKALPGIMAEKFPFSYIASINETWGALTATTTDAMPAYVINLGDLGIGSTTAMGNILPNFTALSEETITEYAPDGFFDLLKTLASIAIILTLFADIFFTTRNLIKT